MRLRKRNESIVEHKGNRLLGHIERFRGPSPNVWKTWKCTEEMRLSRRQVEEYKWNFGSIKVTYSHLITSVRHQEQVAWTLDEWKIKKCNHFFFLVSKNEKEMNEERGQEKAKWRRRRRMRNREDNEISNEELQAHRKQNRRNKSRKLITKIQQDSYLRKYQWNVIPSGVGVGGCDHANIFRNMKIWKEKKTTERKGVLTQIPHPACNVIHFQEEEGNITRITGGNISRGAATVNIELIKTINSRRIWYSKIKNRIFEDFLISV